MALRGALRLPQRTQQRHLEGEELDRSPFDEKTAPGASSCVLWRDLGLENRFFGFRIPISGGFGRRRARGRGENPGFEIFQ